MHYTITSKKSSHEKIQTLIFLPLLLLNVETLAQTGYSRFGVKAGFNTVEASVNDATGFKVKSGFHFGPTYEHLLSNSFSVQTGVLLSMKRSEVNNLNASDYISLPPDDTHILNAAYLILPLQGAYKLHVSKAFKIILGAGPYMGYGVDENGLVVDELKRICRKKKVRMVYVTPHHHYPTTISLRIDRRLELLRLAEEYGFFIFEDDYDFDFHYNHRPLLPLASADNSGLVIYCGSFSKSFSPAFRMGYLVGAKPVIDYLSKVRVLLDRQGDHILDNAMAELISDGTIQRYIRRTLPIYQEKRDLFCQLLTAELADKVNFAVPDGGMTVWTAFDKSIDLTDLANNALRRGLLISDGKQHRYPGYNANATRLGFASASMSDLVRSVDILRSILS